LKALLILEPKTQKDTKFSYIYIIPAEVTNHLQTITMSQTQQPFSAAGRLRQLLSDSNHTVVAPGVYDGISARLALAQGFECLYMVNQTSWQLATFSR
jgi:hypothetical protein